MRTREDFVRLYKEYVEDEFNDTREVSPEQTEFPVMYTTFTHWVYDPCYEENEEHEIQVTYYTDTFTCLVYVDEELVGGECYSDYEGMCNDFECCGFQDFFDWGTHIADLVYNGRMEKGEIR